MKLRSGNFVVNQVNFLRMKKYFVFIIILLASASLSYSMVSVSTENKEISFVQSEKKKVDSGDFERMNNVPIIKAYYNSESNDVEIELCNIGTANVYLVDTFGVIVNETVVETETYVTFTLSSTLCNGNFYVVVDSDYIYAEGYVNR